jgi:hypothetical protein
MTPRSDDMKNSDFLMQPDLAKRIISMLKARQELPSSGIAAGGAVANPLLSLAHGGDFPINDIDIFRVWGNEGLNSRKMPHRFNGSTLFEGYDGIYIVNRYERAYTVLKSDREGMLNEIDIEIARRHNSDEVAGIILDGFDLNCCQAAINLETGRLIYTADFEDFINTLQLKVSSLYTPFHTAIRVPKKLKELGCYCDINTEMKLLSQVPLLLAEVMGRIRRPGIEDNSLYAEYFGEKYLSLYQMNKEIIDKFFALEHYDVTVKSITAENHHLYSLRPLSPIEENLRQCYSPNQLKIMWGLLHGRRAVVDRNKCLLNHDLELIRHFRLRDFVMTIPRYVQCDWDKNHLGQIEKFLDEHPSMIIVFSEMQLNIQEQLCAIRVIKQIAKRIGSFVIGLVETARIDTSTKITEEWIMELINLNEVDVNTPLKVPEDLNGFSYADNIRELLTKKELHEEGDRMHHCVGGYSEAIRLGRSIILHIESYRGPSTLEITKIRNQDSGTLTYRISQHSTLSNKEPADVNITIATELLNFLIKRDNAIPYEEWQKTSRPVYANAQMVTADDILRLLQ